MDLMLELAEVVGHLPVGDLVAVVQVRRVGQEVGHAAKGRLFADRQLERGDAGAETIAQLVERALEAGPFTVELVDEDHAGKVQLGGELPGGVRLDLDALDGADHENRQVSHSECGVHVADEVRVARAVDEVDLVVLPFEGRQRQRQRKVALLFLGIEVAHGRAVFDTSHAGDSAGLVEQSLGQAGLSGSAVSDQCDVADLFRRKALHGTMPPIVVR